MIGYVSVRLAASVVLCAMLAALAYGLFKDSFNTIDGFDIKSTPSTQTAPDPRRERTAESDAIVQAVASGLAHDHNCWDETGPADTLPNGVVYSQTGSLPQYSTDDSIVGLAMHDRLVADLPELRVFAFC